jgi:hypothetical protein
MDIRGEIILKVDKTKMQQFIKNNKTRHQYPISAATQPADKVIEKEDLDPGEQQIT